jgi:putative flavoprotein involved in K+ transport
VLDPGKYREALAAGLLGRRSMFTAFDAEAVVWADGTRERVDTVIFATGYRPSLEYREPLGALENGVPKHVGGISSTHPGLAYTGLELQRSFASSTLRGVSRDAAHVMGPLAAHVKGAYAAVA